MALRAAVAFASAALIVLVGGALLRARSRRRGRRWIRESGGIVLVVALPVGVLAASTLTSGALAIAGGAAALALFGLLRDRVNAPRWTTPLVLGLAAAAVTAAGVRFPLGGVPDMDIAWTMVWLVAVTAAVAGIGNADGQLPGIASASALGIVAIALFARQGAAASIPAALLGALVAFLAYNVRPASLYIGSSGGLCTGFVLAAGSLWMRPAVGRPESLVVSALVVAVPLLDGVVVVLGRIRRRGRLAVRVRDHLAHRLVAVGLRPTRAITVLVVVQAVLSTLAVLVGRGVVSATFGATGALLVLGGLAAAAMQARMREGQVTGFSWRAWLVVFGLVAFAVLASIPAAASAYYSRSRISDGRESAEAALRAARAGDSARAATLFAAAEHQFTEAADRLDSLVNTPSLAIPIVGSNLDAARRLARIGVDLSRAGNVITGSVDPNSLRLVNGRVPLENVAAVAPKFDQAARLLATSERRVADIDTSFLVGEIDDGIAKLNGELSRASRDAAHAAAAARVAPLVLGEDQPRRYLLVVQNPAEARGTGGLIGNWGILTASKGSVRLESLDRVASLNAAGDPAKRVLHAPKDYVARYGRFDPTHSWQSINLSPDFPTVAGVMADVFHESGFAPVDGVLAVDPQGLGALLELTGPVRVPDWPTPVTAQNVVDVTLRDAYAAFARTPDRADFLGDVARVAVNRATTGVLGTPTTLGRVLGTAAHEGHISLWLAAPAEERVADELGISGRVPPSSGDSLLVTNTNAGANKLDYYLQRTLDYSVTVTPSDDLRRASAKGTLGVVLTNTVPASGVPQIAAGPYEGATNRFVYGQNHTFLSIYSPLTFSSVQLGGQPASLEAGQELGRNVASGYFDVFAQKSLQVSMSMAGTVRLASGGWYELTLVHQPTVRTDRVRVHIAVPKGFRVLQANGLHVVNGVAEGTISLQRTRTLRVRIGPAGDLGLWARLKAGP